MILSNFEEGSKYLKELVWKTISSLPKYFSASDPVTKDSHSSSRIDSRTTSNCLSSSDMDIIEIDSFESDDDILVGRDLPINPSNNGTSTSRLWNGACSSDMPNIDRINSSYAPLINLDEEITSWATNGSNAVSTQKRILPPSFQSKDSKPSGSGSRSKNNIKIPQHTQPMKHNSSYGENLHIIDDHRNKNDINIPQHTQTRMLPPYLQHAGKLTESGKTNVPYKYESSNQHSLSSAYMNGNTNFGKQRILPPSMMNEKHVYNPQAVSSYDVGDHVHLAEQRFSELDETAIYEEALQNLSQPNLEDDLPSGLLSVSLLKHQKVALAWMVNKEKSLHCAGGILADDQGLGKTISMIALIQKQRNQQTKFTSNDLSQIKPEALNLDGDGDDIFTDLDKKPFETNNKKEEIPSTSKRPATGTLVVCPASILRQWARELDEKVPNDAKLSVLIYHGGTRTKDPYELAKYDVIITTYAIVTNEVPKQNFNDNDEDREQRSSDYDLHSDFSSKKRKVSNGQVNGTGKGKKKNDSRLDNDSDGPLARVRWFRVILDEAQTIKNHRTQVARACSGLRAKRRWCLSGTPIQNSIDDLYSYFRFLKYDPYSVYGSFCSMIKYPISKNSVNGYKKLQTVLGIMLLRRTKDTKINGEPIINLPSKSVILKKAVFSQEERDFYQKLEGDSRQQFKKYAAAGTVSQNYASILLMLLRLRQACDHPVLVKGYENSDTVGKESLDKARKLSLNMQCNLLQKLEGFSICGVCNDPPEDAVVTLCGHVFCYQCVSERLTGDETTCPSLMCKTSLSPSSVFSRATLKISMSGGLDNNNIASSSGLLPDNEVSVVERTYVSSKIKAAVEILNNLSSPYYNVHTNECDGSRPNTEPVKAIVFSQWTGMLDLLELSLNQSLIQYRRLDGSMSLPSRDNAVKEFNTNPEVTVMIMSLKAGNLGLNMVAACHVILLDLWWNPTTEDQAVDRAHRIGQTRPVTVSRLTIKDTVEDRILALQEEKRKMVASAFGEDGGGRSSKLTVDDLSYLFMV